MIVTYEENGVSKLMDANLPVDVMKKGFLDTITENLHKHSRRDQMTAEFKKLCGDNPSDNTIGYALDEISKMRFRSKVEHIEFHYGKTIKNFNVKLNHA